jgi:enhancing lycopene biosynthesis protein 2
MRRVGVLLAGCGIYDGSEIQEAVLVLLVLRRRSLRPVCLAPDVDQTDVVDHTSGDPLEGAQPRGTLIESARLARGVIRAVRDVPPEDLDAIVVPGGFGVVKNLCLPGSRGLGGGPLRPEVDALIDHLERRRAPLAALGLGEVVLARRHDRPLSQAPVAARADEVIVDEERRTLFTPGFMATDDIVEVASGIDKLIDHLARWLGVVPGLLGR